MILIDHLFRYTMHQNLVNILLLLSYPRNSVKEYFTTRSPDNITILVEGQPASLSRREAIPRHDNAIRFPWNLQWEWLGWAWASPTLVELHCGSVFVTYLQPYTLNACLNISQKLNILVHALSRYVKGNAGLLPECGIGKRSGDGSNLSTHSTFLFGTAATDRPSMAGCSQTVQIIHRQVEITSGKGRA